MGASRRSRWNEFLRGSVINGVLRSSGTIDVHVISTEREEGHGAPTVRRPVHRSYLSRRRQRTGWLLAVARAADPRPAALDRGPELRALRACCCSSCCSSWSSLRSAGSLPAVLAAVSGSLFANFYFTPPMHTFTIDEGENLLALFVFLVVAGVVSWLVEHREPANRRRRSRPSRGGDAGRARRDARDRGRPACRSSSRSCGPRSRPTRWRCCGIWTTTAGRSRPSRVSRSRPDPRTARSRCRSARWSSSWWWARC